MSMSWGTLKVGSGASDRPKRSVTTNDAGSDTRAKGDARVSQLVVC